MTAPAAIHELVEKFEQHRKEYQQHKNETELRREFLDPFFEALGWDVFNRKSYSERYKEVMHESSVEVEGKAKAADYAFRAGDRIIFFVEAKKPSVNIETNPEPAFQLRRYGWSAKLPINILTDFEQLAVYDCREKPDKGDKASKGRPKLYHFSEYVEKWDEISGLFGREAVLRGALEQFVEVQKGKKGTTEVDDAFLEEIERWRDLLARNLALRNPGLNVRELNYAVQMTIDRIIFLRICEDRGIEPDEQLHEIATPSPHRPTATSASDVRSASPKSDEPQSDLGEAGRGSIYANLLALFKRADTKYNSGLFHFAADTLTPALQIDDKVLKDILHNLYYPESPYVFNYISADILGQVYERFLGKVIRLTAGHQAKVEEKPEVRKAGGVYYTPTYIVDYIVKNTIGKLVEGKTPENVTKLKFVDPACGSGSFLLGAYQYLLDWHLQWFTANEPEKWARGSRPAIVQVDPHRPAATSPKSDEPQSDLGEAGRGLGEWRLTTEEKKRILLDNIHGVDIDAQAVEVTKLSLLLKVLEGTSGQLRLGLERVLPDLSQNIQCGNSLIGPDYYDGRQMPMFGDDEFYRVNVFDWKKAFPAVFAAGGFDAVIGNPPYIRIQRISHDDADYLYKTYKSPTSKSDISLIFIEKTISLTSLKGKVGLICTSQWLTTDYGKNLRLMLSDGRLQKIVDFGSLPVFETAQTYPAIFILSPEPTKRLEVIRVTSQKGLNLEAIQQASPIFISLENLNGEPWNLGFFDVIHALKKRKIAWEPLSKFGGAYIGALTGMDDAFVVTEKEIVEHHLERSLLLPYAYRAGDIYKFALVNPRAMLIYPYIEGKNGSPQLISERDLEKSFPSIHSYLMLRKESLRKRMDSRKLYASGTDWYRFLRPGSFKYIRPEKLIIKGIEKSAVVGLLEKDTVFNGANCPGIILDNLGSLSISYILGILNTKLTSYYLRSVCPPKLNDYRRFNANNINIIPIRTIDFSNPAEKAAHDWLVGLVEQMLALHRQSPRTPQEKEMLARQIESTDAAIDKLVYELYGLTEEEIKVVKGK